MSIATICAVQYLSISTMTLLKNYARIVAIALRIVAIVSKILVLKVNAM